MAIVVLAGCSTTATPPAIPRAQPSWYSVNEPDTGAVAREVCPKGDGPGDVDCRSKVPGYDTCVRRHPAKTSATLCKQALIVRVGCRFGERGAFNNEKACAASFDSYLSCRTGTPVRSDEVCAAGEREFSRCPPTFDPAGGFDCVKARDAYYECRDDRRGDDTFCSTYIEVLGLCHTLRVGCSDLLDRYLGCADEDLSPNECAFGLTMRLNCLRDLGDGVFRQAATCDSVWRGSIRDCGGRQSLDTDGPTPCTGGRNWNTASYSICEKLGDPAETVGVAYVYSTSVGRTPVCWAPEDGARPMTEAAERAFGERGVRLVHRHGETRHEPM
ncbi:hypothetical protein [Streptosporangium vulgare]|uniref:hypothetical protein n=1 Tax=Streptosporangium vulgare TaxID=46190 RepID=UPI0036DAB379